MRPTLRLSNGVWKRRPKFKPECASGTFTCDGVSDVVCDVGGDVNVSHTCPCKKGNRPICEPPGCAPSPIHPDPRHPTPPNPAKHNCKGMLTDLQKIILLNKAVLAVNQDTTPQGFPVVEGDSAVWARHLTGGDVALALYNEADEARSLGASFASLGWSAETVATVKDLWGKHSCAKQPVASSATGQVANMTVGPHSTLLLRLSKASPQ